MANAVVGAIKGLAKLRPVFTHLRKGFSLIVTPHGTGTTVTFDLPANIGVVIFALIIVFFVGIGFVGVTYTKLAVLAVRASKLNAENRVLRAENAKIREIEAELVYIENLKRQIETWAGMIEGKRGEGGDVQVDLPSTNLWPRRYTYAIMKPFYTGLASHPNGLMLPADGWVSRGFSAGAKNESGHPGIDIVVPRGTPVRCALEGTVRSAGWDDVYGNMVVVAHGDSLETVYGHNDKILVKEGDRVTKGQVIAVAGSTGRSTAPHIHFGVVINGKPVDPAAYMELIKS
jgi:murein DD-endopeptidase MepM/ murein hydrolase activator NlpD